MSTPPAEQSREPGGPLARTAPRPRALELRLLALCVPLAALGAAVTAAPRDDFQAAFVEVALPLGWLLGAALAVHLLFRAVRFQGDPFLLPALAALLVLGAVYHAGLRPPGPANTLPDFLRAALVALGTVGAVVCLAPFYRRLNAWLEERVWWRVVGPVPYYESVPFLLGLCLLMVFLIAVLFVGGRPVSETGAIVQAPLIGGLSFTPSEFVRLAIAFFLADYLGRNSRLLRNIRQPLARAWPLRWLTVEHAVTLGILLGVVALYCLFFFVFRDFGPAVILYALAVLVLYAATGRLGTPLALVAIAAALAWLAVQTGAGSTMLNRLTMWLDPWETSFRFGDHQARILWSIASGGWLGMPLETAVPRHLPEATRDAAFAGLVARHGLWVGLAVLGLFAVIAARGLAIARAGVTDRDRLLAFSLTALLALQVVWICGAMVRALPFTGINVPFVSTGMSNALACAIALGALLNVSQRAATGAAAGPGEASPEVARGVRRLGPAVLASFLIPAFGLALLAPWVSGDRVLTRVAIAYGRGGEISPFSNPYLEAFRRQTERGRLSSADGELLAVSRPTEADYELVRRRNPQFEPRLRALAERGERAYPLGEDAAQLVGWAPDGRWLAGIGSVETTADGLLRGYRLRDLPRRFRGQLSPFHRPPEPLDVELTIEARLQRRAAALLRQAVGSASAAGGAVVLLEADTGRVLAAASAPSFDPNGLSLPRMEEYVEQHRQSGILTNKALSPEARTFPGSTAKILTLAAALPELAEGSSVCRGSNAAAIEWEYRGARYSRPAGRISEAGGTAHGSLSFAEDYAEALARSCNVFFAHLAAATGPERLRAALADAELGRLPDVEALADYLPEAGFGQVVLTASPLELAQLAAAIGMGGETPRAHWLSAVLRDEEASPPRDVPGAPERRAYRPFDRRVVGPLREALVAAIEDPAGTGYAAFHGGGEPLLPRVVVGGKTGTAEFEKQGEGRGRHLWFVGFAESRRGDGKNLAVAVLVEDAAPGTSGGRICAPVARQLFAEALGPWEPPPGLQLPDVEDVRGWLERFWDWLRFWRR